MLPPALAVCGVGALGCVYTMCGGLWTSACVLIPCVQVCARAPRTRCECVPVEWALVDRSTVIMHLHMRADVHTHECVRAVVGCRVVNVRQRK